MKMYILVRKDLNWSNRMVQACHAIAEFMAKHASNPVVQQWNSSTQTMVLLGVDTENDLWWWTRRLDAESIVHHICREPDLSGNQATALVVSPDASPEIFKDLKILR